MLAARCARRALFWIRRAPPALWYRAPRFLVAQFWSAVLVCGLFARRRTRSGALDVRTSSRMDAALYIGFERP